MSKRRGKLWALNFPFFLRITWSCTPHKRKNNFVVYLNCIFTFDFLSNLKAAVKLAQNI